MNGFVKIENETNTTTAINTEDWQNSASTEWITTTTGNGYNCAGCGLWVYSGYTHICSYQYCQPWIQVWPGPKPLNEVAELKAWIEGFMEGRKMTERNLQKIRDKLQDFCD